jgi:hypothetical protein
MPSMGFQFGLEQSANTLKRKFRWLLKIPGISADSSVNSLPPSKSARPNLSFKEVEVKHLVETVYYPGRPEWKTINLTLFDLQKNENPIIAWFKNIYDVTGNGTWTPSGENNFKKQATLEMYNGCGDTIETWNFDNVWPQTIEFGELDMTSPDVVMIDVTLRYDRAFIS